MASPTQWHEFEQTPGDSEGQGSLNEKVKLKVFVTPWTVVCQVFLSMEFSRQEY